MNKMLLSKRKSLFSFKNESHFNKIRHENAYSNILATYVESLSISLKIKRQLKVWFFILTMGSLCVMVILFTAVLIYACWNLNKMVSANEITINSIIGILTIIIPAISSLIVGFIKIPEIIARYLFNTKEDYDMRTIIKYIQDYDIVIYKMDPEINKLLNDQKEQNMNTDAKINESPVKVSK